MRTMLRSILVLAVLLGSSLAAPAADPAEVEASPQAKAYRASEKAIAAGDEKAYAKTLTSEASKQMETKAKELGKTPKELMELLQVMQPTNVELGDLKVDGKKATLTATGKADGETRYGTIELEDENGQWKVRKSKWSNVKK